MRPGSPTRRANSSSRWIAKSSPDAAAFGGLRAGQVVMLGSVTLPIWLERPGVIEVRFPPLDPVHLTLT